MPPFHDEARDISTLAGGDACLNRKARPYVAILVGQKLRWAEHRHHSPVQTNSIFKEFTRTGRWWSTILAEAISRKWPMPPLCERKKNPLLLYCDEGNPSLPNPRPRSKRAAQSSAADERSAGTPTTYLPPGAQGIYTGLFRFMRPHASCETYFRRFGAVMMDSASKAAI